MNGEGYETEGFEYDTEDTEAAEDTEAEAEADEGFEAAELDESDTESDEMYESDESDESDETTTIGETIEASDEADVEADEAVDEAVRMSAAARYRADRDRGARWSRRVAAVVNKDAAAARAAQRAIADRIRSIPVKARTRVATVGTLQGAGVVTAILPNGRRTRMRIIPTVAPISEVNRLRAVVLANEKRQAAVINTNTKAITQLAAAQTAAVKKLTEQQVKSDKDLSQRLVEGDNRLDARITKELSGGSGIIEKHNKRLIRTLRRERRRAMMNNVLLATSIPFFVSYGDRETPFTRDNAILAGSTLFWLLGDDVISSWSRNRGFAQGLASGWSYAAPFANGGGLYFWFRNKQNQRFLAGITKLDFAKGAVIDLTGELKKDGIDPFKNNDHAVVATFVDAAAKGSIRAILDKATGKLTLNISKDPASGESPADTSGALVAWIVDTKTTKTVQGTQVP